MDFKFLIKTNVIFGNGCIKNNKDAVKLGKKAMIVTGKNSAVASGALGDITQVLKEQDIDYIIFDKVENNPSLENVKEAGNAAASYGADFIIGIGGGSPLDASKAVAVLAVNDIDPLELYGNKFINTPLPIIAIPTTAGTGSEVTPYSILTRKDLQTKMSFGNQDTFPAVAFIDPEYTKMLPLDVTVNTAVDALSHLMEGYICKRSMPVSDALAIHGISVFGECIDGLLGASASENTSGSANLTMEIREKLMYASMIGGMVIAHTGTTLVHALGYSLTYFKNLPHGKANGLLMEEHLKFIYDAAKTKVDKVLNLLNIKSIEQFGKIIDNLLKVDKAALNLNPDEYITYAALAMKQRSVLNTPGNVTEDDIVDILNRTFAK